MAHEYNALRNCLGCSLESTYVVIEVLNEISFKIDVNNIQLFVQNGSQILHNFLFVPKMGLYKLYLEKTSIDAYRVQCIFFILKFYSYLTNYLFQVSLSLYVGVAELKVFNNCLILLDF